MASINITLSDELQAWVDSQVTAGRYVDASDLVRDVLRTAREDEADVGNLRDLIEEGRASGISDRTLEDIRRDVRAKLGMKDADAA